MTDIWCFTCSHEIRELYPRGYVHLDPVEAEMCICTEDGEECTPR